MEESQHRYAQCVHCPRAGTGCDTLVDRCSLWEKQTTVALVWKDPVHATMQTLWSDDRLPAKDKLRQVPKTQEWGQPGGLNRDGERAYKSPCRKTLPFQIHTYPHEHAYRTNLKDACRRSNTSLQDNCDPL
ncbi:putative protein diaphanous-like protein 2 [Triplophysa rosa]|uniref:Uncharacterized protein n=1 Tax=Triplophysa rosa TaxID=992332 RepID=A0A9W7TQW1_TRIRA|nr:putative protein diaphanous-like protein 2 [Triplophysa rosa]